jgi:hypothetical protein
MAGYVVWREAGPVPALAIVGAASFIPLWWRWAAARPTDSEAQTPLGTVRPSL